MVSARTFPAPARDACDPCNCAPIHAHIRPAYPPSEHPTCARNHCLICTLSTLFTYMLTGDTRQHYHLRKPLREHAEQAGRPRGRWVSSTPSSAPSAEASGGPVIEIQHLFIVYSMHAQGRSERSHRSSLTDDYYFELPVQAQLPRRLPIQRLAAVVRGSASASAAPRPRPAAGATAVPVAARQEVLTAGRGGEDRLGGGRSRAGVGTDGSRPASRADRPRRDLLRAHVPWTRLGPMPFNFCDPDVRALG